MVMVAVYNMPAHSKILDTIVLHWTSSRQNVQQRNARHSDVDENLGNRFIRICIQYPIILSPCDIEDNLKVQSHSAFSHYIQGDVKHNDYLNKNNFYSHVKQMKKSWEFFEFSTSRK